MFLFGPEECDRGVEGLFAHQFGHERGEFDQQDAFVIVAWFGIAKEVFELIDASEEVGVGERWEPSWGIDQGADRVEGQFEIGRDVGDFDLAA